MLIFHPEQGQVTHTERQRHGMAAHVRGSEIWDVELDGCLLVLNLVLKSDFMMYYWIKTVNCSKFRQPTGASGTVQRTHTSVQKDV